MKRFVEMLRRPGWLALAILAVGVATAEAQQQTRATASRHAARQVRLPAEKPAAPKAKAVKPMQDHAVQPAAHATVVATRPAAQRPGAARLRHPREHCRRPAGRRDQRGET